MPFSVTSIYDEKSKTRQGKSMKEYGIIEKPQEKWPQSGIPFEQYYSVEFSINGLTCVYQFKIWKMVPESICFLVKGESEILERINVGDVIKMKYYTTDSGCPTKNMDTEISYINKDDEGRFKGHYLVGLAILEDETEKNIH